jgi:hypothetical protein
MVVQLGGVGLGDIFLVFILVILTVVTTSQDSILLHTVFTRR